MDHRKRLVPIATTIDDPSKNSALDLANSRKSSFHSECTLLSLEITIAVRQVTPALLCKKKGNFQKILVVVCKVRKKYPVTNRSFQKELQDIVETKSPRARTFGAKSYKSAGNKKLFEMNITLERKEIFSSFERKSTPESLAQNVPEWPSPSHARNLSFTHDGYIRHTATEMIILMTDISVIWHSTG